MGEKIKDIAQFKIKNSKIHIELNKANSPTKDKKFEVHIQGESFRYDLSVHDLLLISNTIQCAENFLKIYKDIKS